MTKNHVAAMVNARTEQIVADIVCAFRDNAYPGNDRIAYDQSGTHLECSEIVAAFQGKQWQEVDLETLVRESSAVYFFTPAAFAYYLPAFLCAALLHHGSSDAVPGTVINCFVLPSHQMDQLAHRQRLSAMTARQLAVIKLTLLHLKGLYPEDNVLGEIDKAVSQLDQEEKDRKRAGSIERQQKRGDEMRAGKGQA